MHRYEVSYRINGITVDLGIYTGSRGSVIDKLLDDFPEIPMDAFDVKPAGESPRKRCGTLF